MPEPPERENKLPTWPNWPLKMRTSSSHQEAAKREFAVLTHRFSGEQGKVKTLHCVHVDGKMQPIIGSEFAIKADLVLLAMGFVHPVHEGLLNRPRRRARPAQQTPTIRPRWQRCSPASDMRRGQSLVVWAIREGRQCAHMIDRALMGRARCRCGGDAASLTGMHSLHRRPFIAAKSPTPGAKGLERNSRRGDCSRRRP